MIKFICPEVDVLKKNKRIKVNTGKKVFSLTLYVLGIIFICAGVLGLLSIENETFKSAKTFNSNLNKAVSTKELVNSFQ